MKFLLCELLHKICSCHVRHNVLGPDSEDLDTVDEKVALCGRVRTNKVDYGTAKAPRVSRAACNTRLISGGAMP